MRQTDRRQTKALLNASTVWGGGIINVPDTTNGGRQSQTSVHRTAEFVITLPLTD